MGYLGRFQFSNSYLNRVSAMDCPKHLGLCYRKSDNGRDYYWQYNGLDILTALK